MSYLNWISDSDLTDAVEDLLSSATKAKRKAQKNFGSNVIDPFSAISEMAGFDMSFDEWLISEEARQAQKSLQNSIGNFHQKILGLSKGWQNMGTGHVVDLVCDNKKIIAEIKNKYNTISGGKLADLYWSLEESVTQKVSIYKGYTAYYVMIIPKKPVRFDTEFTPSDKKKGQKCPQNKLVKQIDGASFYDLVTGEQNALKDLFEIMPRVIFDISKNKNLEKEKLKGLFKIAYG